MRATFMYGAGEVRIETVPDPVLQRPSDALVRIVRSCICGSDLHPYHSMSGGHGAHKVLEAVGLKPAYEQAVGIVRAGGVISRVGLPQYEDAPVGFASLGLDEVPDGYRAMDQRKALKVLIRP